MRVLVEHPVSIGADLLGQPPIGCVGPAGDASRIDLVGPIIDLAESRLDAGGQRQQRQQQQDAHSSPRKHDGAVEIFLPVQDKLTVKAILRQDVHISEALRSSSSFGGDMTPIERDASGPARSNPGSAAARSRLSRMIAAADRQMVSSPAPPRRRPLRIAALLAMAAIAACARNPLVGSVSVPPVPAGEARLWFYRVYLPSDTLNMTKVTMNGAYAGYAQLGGAFYRDVPPGVYHIEVESWGRDFNQSTNVALVAGQEAYRQSRIAGQLGDRSWRRIYRRPRHVLRPADVSADRARRNRTKLLRRRQLTAGLRHARRRRCRHRSPVSKAAPASGDAVRNSPGSAPRCCSHRRIARRAGPS